MEWINEKDKEKPRDGTKIQMWHKMWKCPVSVKFSKLKEYEKTPWLEITLSTCWPEESFTEHWMSLPDAPTV